MKHRARLVIILVTLVLALSFALPVVGASAPGAVILCIGDVCTSPRIHFNQSLDCYLLGAGPAQWIGVYYFDGEFGIGCGPLVV